MGASLPRVAALLLGSGACALVDQLVWLRELRLGPTAAWRHSGIGAGRASAALSRPFAAFSLDEERRSAAFEIAAGLGLVPQCVKAAAAFEPWVPWRRDFLQRRLACYEAAGDPRAARARADLTVFDSAELEPLRLSSSTR